MSRQPGELFPWFQTHQIHQHHRKGEWRAQHQGHGQKHQHRGAVHGVPYDAVESGVDELLPLFHLHGPGKVDVFPQHLAEEPVAQQKDACRREGHPAGQHHPVRAVVESRQDEGQQEHETAQGDHRPLFPFALPCFQPPAQQLRTFEEHDQPRQEHGDKEDAHEKPGPPKVQRPRRQEQQQAYQQHSAEEFDHCLPQQCLIHTRPPKPSHPS